jgi:DNA primase
MIEPHRIPDAVIDEIRARVSLVARSVKLQRAGRGFKALCPFHQERTPSFTVSDERGFYHCFGCGAHGDVFRWVQETQGLDFPDAVRRLAEDSIGDSALAPAQRQGRRGVEERVPVPSSEAGRWIWRTSVPARGTIVEAWLGARALDPEAAFLPGSPAIDRLRFHSACPAGSWVHGADPRRHWLTAPAMVAPIVDATGAVRGVHCTYLSSDGRRKADFPPKRDGEARETRKIFGRAAGLAVWLAGPGAPGPPLIVGEGIETSWSYAQDFVRPARVAAALSLDNLQGREKRLRDGSVPLWRPQSDPERSVFTISDPGDVIVLVDADMKPLRDQKVQLARGARPVRADISPLQRAELCADLAAQAWRRAGARRVATVRPPMGHDFNDLAMEAAA